MKKTLLIILFGIWILPIVAQPSITASSFDFGKTTRYFTTNDSVNPNMIPPTNNAVWDYRFLTARSTDSVIFSKKTNSSYTSSFPLANEVIEEYTPWMAGRAVERHNYKDSQIYIRYGGVFIPGNKYNYKPAQIIFKFPFDFNTSFHDSLYGIVTYDGYGTLHLPGGTFTNVYRTNSFDSVSPFNKQYTYNWFNSERRLLTVYLNSGTHQTTFYSPYNSATGIARPDKNDKPILFPNPSSGEITIQNISIADKVEIFNALGVLVYSGNKLKSNTTIQLDTKGVFILKIHTQSGVHTERLFVK